MKRIGIQFVFWSMISFSCCLALWLPFKILDYYFSVTTIVGPNATAAPYGGIVELDLYPYTGFHVQSNYHHKGDMVWERQPYKDYDVRTGDLGFFGFHLQQTYPKARNEFRIVWIGGSGAQGWGGQTNEKMMYELIPKFLNEKFRDCDIKISMVNFAMGASSSYQNFLALNRWAHPLLPDLVISYSGRNDVFVPMTVDSDAHLFFPPLEGLVYASRKSESRGFVAWLDRQFPALLESGSNLGKALRILFNYSEHVSRAMENGYGKRSNTGGKAPKDFLEQVIQPQYLHAMKSIKRDFDGIPVAIVLQAVLDIEWQQAEIYSRLGRDFYARFFNNVKADLSNYQNDKWLFLDGDQFLRNYTDSSVNTGTHLGNAGQEAMSRFIADGVYPMIKKIRKLKCGGQ